MIAKLKRREFIMLLGGAAAGWPLAALAQQDRMRRVGMLSSLAADDPQSQARNAVLLQGLQELGWVVGRDLRIDFRWGEGDVDRTRKYAAELVALKPDVILAVGASTVKPLQQATHTVPLVFLQVTDPVGAGLVATLARPGGNITSFTNFEFATSG